MLAVNPLINYMPQEIAKLNDTVYAASFYTFGPTVVRLHLGGKDYPFLLLPNSTSTIRVLIIT